MIKNSPYPEVTVNSESFANSVKRHICDAQMSRLRLDLAISVNDRVILSFREGLIFTKLRIKPSRKFPNLQYAFFHSRRAEHEIYRANKC